jgi:hypothetical protein
MLALHGGATPRVRASSSCPTHSSPAPPRGSCSRPSHRVSAPAPALAVEARPYGIPPRSGRHALPGRRRLTAP